MPFIVPHNPQDKVHFLPGLQGVCDVAPQRSHLLFLSLHALSSIQARLLAFRRTCLHIHICTYHLPTLAHVAPYVDNSLPSNLTDLGSNTGSSTDLRP